MGNWLQIKRSSCLALSLILSASIAGANDEGDLMKNARSALRANDERLADSFYKQIKFTSPLFTEKISDLIRYHILKQQWKSAWQLTQLAQRLRLESSPDEWTYYRDLSLALNGTCSLGESYAANDGRAELLAAYHYRFPLRFADSGGVNGNSDTLQLRIPRTSVHYLADIGRAMPVKGQGCRLYRGRLTKTDGVNIYELDALKDWYDAVVKSKQLIDLPKGGERVLVRMFVLLSKNDDDADLKQELAQYFAKMPDTKWQSLATDEAIWLWQQLIEAKLKPTSEQVGSVELKLVKEIILAGQSGRVSEWLGYIPLTRWTDLSERQKIVEHLLTIEDLPERTYFQASLADIYHQRGRWQNALKLIRDVLVEQEGSARPEVSGFCVDLTGKILAEYRYSNEVLGALQTALPREQWRQTLQNLMLSYALQGDKQSFKRVSDEVNAKTQKLSGKKYIFAKDEDAVLELIATRRVDAFRNAINEWSKSKRVRESSLRFLAVLMRKSLQLEAEDQQRLQPFFAEFAEYSRHLLNSGAERKTAEDLLHFFAEHSKSDWIKGSRDTRSGVQSAGIVSIRESFTIVNPFEFARAVPPMPQLLLLMPADIAEGQWQIATELSDTLAKAKP